MTNAVLNEKEKNELGAVLEQTEVFEWARDNGFENAISGLKKLIEAHGMEVMTNEQ